VCSWLICTAVLKTNRSENNVLFDEIRSELGTDVDETTLDLEENKRRKPDCGVTDRGLIQAKCLGRCAMTGFNGVIKEDVRARWQIYCSPMRRCLLTCRAMMAGLDDRSLGSVIVNRSLYESGGCYHRDVRNAVVVGVPGATSIEIEQEFGFVCEDSFPEGWYARDYKESLEDFERRCMAIVEWLWEIWGEGRLVGLTIVAHGNLISSILSGLLFGAPKSCLFVHHNCGISHVKLTTAGPRGKRLAVMQYMDRVDHLPETVLTGAHFVDDHWVQEFISF